MPGVSRFRLNKKASKRIILTRISLTGKATLLNGGDFLTFSGSFERISVLYVGLVNAWGDNVVAVLNSLTSLVGKDWLRRPAVSVSLIERRFCREGVIRKRQ